MLDGVVDMVLMTEPHERLKIAREAAGYSSASKAAEAIGIKSSTYRAHENNQNNLNWDAARRYGRFFKVHPMWIMDGTGEMGDEDGLEPREQDVARKEIRLAEDAPDTKVPPSPDTPIPDEITDAGISVPLLHEMAKDVPVWGTAAGSQNGAFVINAGDAIDYVRRPPGLVGKKDIYGIYVEGDSMEPRFESGDLIFINPHRPPKVSDYVVVVVQLNGADDHEAFVGRLRSRRGSSVVLDKLNPEMELPLENVRQVLKIVSNTELFGI